MPKKKTSPFRKKIVAFQKKVMILLTFLTSQKNLMIFRKQVKSTFTLTLSKIAVFYKKSEFNRGLVIGLGLTLVFFVGYTAKAALPTTANLPAFGTTAYQELFPAGYLKPHEMKYFRYHVDATNGNEAELNPGKITPVNDLPIYSERGDEDVNFQFFTNKLNNASNNDLPTCLALNTNNSGACGKIVTFSHRFAKHLSFYPGSRGVASGTDVPAHMYFYKEDRPIKIYVKDAVIQSQYPTHIIEELLLKFDFKKSLKIDQAYASLSPIAVPEKPTTSTDQKFFIRAKISELITLNILDPKVFKSTSYLTRSDGKASYVYTAITAEPKDNFINRAPQDYKADFANYFNSNVIANNILPYYKKTISKLYLRDGHDYNSAQGRWELRGNAIDREIINYDLSSSTMRASFYNTSISNFVRLTIPYRAKLVLAESSAINGYRNLYLFEGRTLSGVANSTYISGKATIEFGSLPSINNPCDYNKVSCQMNFEIVEEDQNFETAFKRPQNLKHTILNLFLFKQQKASAAGDPSFFSAFANTEVKISDLISKQIITGHNFRPRIMYDPKEEDNYDKLIWKQEIVAWDASEPMNEPGYISPFQDLGKGGTGSIHTADVKMFLKYSWDSTLTNNYIFRPGITNNYNVTFKSTAEKIVFDVRNSTGSFKLTPHIPLNPSNPNIDLLISASDSDLRGVNPNNDIEISGNLCKIDPVTQNAVSCLSGTIAMSNYSISANIADDATGYTSWETDPNRVYSGEPGTKVQYRIMHLILAVNYKNKEIQGSRKYIPIYVYNSELAPGTPVLMWPGEINNSNL